ncbi:DgyrCDS10171 [Dimorphilus gyrociliatus]|uniref:L-fucose mutarotase n=1 Tax=Dimorphilus gyrociliatus TaxID=2664684 RepID=A0A7I8W0T1_9ANNE|nr:DgyrCDS10171 [Dimorphilus gyrociliatus]
MPLKGIPFNLSPDLLKLLSAAGHGDEIILADAHFPTTSICKGENAPVEIRADGLLIPPLLTSILKFFPLDQYVGEPVALMQRTADDEAKNLPVPIWDEISRIVNEAEGKKISIEKMDRFDFYGRARSAFAIIHTGDVSQYGNVIIKKGVVYPPTQ